MGNIVLGAFLTFKSVPLYHAYDVMGRMFGLAAGRSAPAIAAELHVSTATVKTHLKTLYEKLGVSDRAAAVAESMRRGLIE